MMNCTIRLSSRRLLRPCAFTSENSSFWRCFIGTTTADRFKFGGAVSLAKGTKLFHQCDCISGLFRDVQVVRTIRTSGLLMQNKVMPNEKPGPEVSSKSELLESSEQAATDNSTTEAQQSRPQPLSRKAQLKQAIKDYGATVIIFHVTMSLGSLGFFYMLVSSGLDVLALLESFGVSKSVLESKVTQGASTFVVAYAVHKVFAPVRITITLTAVPFLVKYLRRIGFLKAVKQ